MFSRAKMSAAGVIAAMLIFLALDEGSATSISKFHATTNEDRNHIISYFLSKLCYDVRQKDEALFKKLSSYFYTEPPGSNQSQCMVDLFDRLKGIEVDAIERHQDVSDLQIEDILVEIIQERQGVLISLDDNNKFVVATKSSASKAAGVSAMEPLRTKPPMEVTYEGINENKTPHAVKQTLRIYDGSRCADFKPYIGEALWMFKAGVRGGVERKLNEQGVLDQIKNANSGGGNHGVYVIFEFPVSGPIVGDAKDAVTGAILGPWVHAIEP